MKKFSLLTIQFLTLCLLQSPAFAVQTLFTGVQVVKGSEYTSLVFNITSPQGYKVFTLQHPNRLVVDITEGHLRTDTSNLDLSGTHLTHVRHARFDPHTFRVVFDMDVPLVRFNASMRALNPNQAQL